MRKWVGPFLARLGGGLLCRGCLRELDVAAEAGLCGRCWEGLLALDALRCPRCTLIHAEETECPEPVAWARGDALWDYHGGRPAFGALLVPGIKAGEGGWRGALLRRAAAMPLPEWTAGCEVVVPVPTQAWKRILRGFDLAEDWARLLGRRLDLPRNRALAKTWLAPSQTGRTESRRRSLPKRSLRLRPCARIAGKTVLLVDDVWTTGTTLLRCAKLLGEGGAAEVRVLTLFRAT